MSHSEDKQSEDKKTPRNPTSAIEPSAEHAQVDDLSDIELEQVAGGASMHPDTWSVGGSWSRS